jgi:UDP-N-acetylmuramyl pentapeptide phosphotransferase/UDP-N-acetylglucosamine-1-phosphate transferase
MVVMLLSAFAVAAVVSAFASLVALRAFSWFRSGERKPGDFRPDQSTGSDTHHVEIRTRGKRPRVVRARSSELPLVGGAAMIIAILAGSVATGFLLNFSESQWKLTEILMLVTVGYGVVGLTDDMRKVYRGVGISEIQKAIGVVLVSALAAILINRLIIDKPITARLAYPPYNQAPIIGSLLVHQKFAWVIFFIAMTIIISSTTALAVDFADGMDGLAGGLLFSAALAYAVIMIDVGGSARWPLIACALALAGATVGYLPFNWPSPWKGGPKPKGKRLAKVIMGDTGSLALGGLLALIAIIARQEFLLLIIGGAFVLEGLSALISARILVKFYRRFLFVERFNASKGFPHTELPLPFLATPMHHHYDLLNIDRRRLVYGAWLLGAGLAILGIASAVGPFTWERYLARLAGLVVLIAIWQAGPWTKTFFIGLESANSADPHAPRRLILCHGAPFKLFGLPLYRRIDSVSITNTALQQPMEPMMLWQRLSVFDARSLLGYYCYRAGKYEDALRIWDRIPDPNVEARPDLQNLIKEVTHAIAVRTVDSAQAARSLEQAYPEASPAPVGDPNASAFRMPAPPKGALQTPRLEFADPKHLSAPADSSEDSAPFWRASVWAAANGLTPLNGHVPNPGDPLAAPPLTEPTGRQDGQGAGSPPEVREEPEMDSLSASGSIPGAKRPTEDA